MTFSPESVPQEKIPEDKLVLLDNKLEKLQGMLGIDVGSDIESLRRSIDHVLHEKSTGDDSPHKYSYVLSNLAELNNTLAKLKQLPEKIEL